MRRRLGQAARPAAISVPWRARVGKGPGSAVGGAILGVAKLRRPCRIQGAVWAQAQLSLRDVGADLASVSYPHIPGRVRECWASWVIGAAGLLHLRETWAAVGGALGGVHPKGVIIRDLPAASGGGLPPFSSPTLPGFCDLEGPQEAAP